MSFIRNAAIAVFCTALAFVAPVRAHEYTHGDLSIGHPWTRATPPSAKVAGGYLTVTNNGKQPDRLLSASFTLSNITEVHEMAVEKGVMRMRELPKGIEIKPGEKLTLAPGGYHLMFIDLKQGLKEGGSARGVLVFEHAGRVEVDFKVESIGKQDGHDHHHDHGKAKTQ
ncbi:MAG: copper chaperone PCu(A)C [Beijerinckiaceae bacterium]